jgi:putative SOS response-associated peptidase YedK
VCANYIPVTSGEELLAFFGVERDFARELPPELYPTELAPFIRLVHGGRVAEPGRFGLLPPWRRELKFGRRTYNTRSETVHSLPSFKDSWRRGLRCVIPAKAVYEPRYNDDFTVERWRIEKADGTPFGIAGIYSQWMEGGQEKFSFSMVTVNCDGHPFYGQFHEPGAEKRMPVFLEPEDYDGWMACALKDAPKYFRQSAGPFNGFAQAAVRKAAKPTAAPKVARQQPPPTPAPPLQGDLF